MATATVRVVDHKGETCTARIENLSCALVSVASGEKKDYSVGEGECDIRYVPTD